MFHGNHDESIGEWIAEFNDIINKADFDDIEKAAMLTGRLGEGPLRTAKS